MGTVTRWLFRQLVVACGTSLLGLGLLTLPPACLSALYKLGGADPDLLLGFLPLLSAELLPHLLPIAFLLAVIRMMARLVARREWLGLVLTGRNPLHHLLPIFGVAAVLTGSSLWVLHRTVPSLRFEQATYLRSAAVESARRALLGKTTVTLGEFTLIAKSLDGNDLVDAIARLDDDESGHGQYLTADRIRVVDLGDDLELDLEGVRYLHAGRSGSFGQIRATIPLDRILRVSPPNPNKATFLTSQQIQERIDQELEVGRGMRLLHYKMHARTALSFAYVAFAFLGIVLGLRAKTESTLVPLGLAIVVAGFHHVLNQEVGRQLALGETIPIWMGAWLGNTIVLLSGLGMMLSRWAR